jgi:hypothetical protein
MKLEIYKTNLGVFLKNSWFYNNLQKDNTKINDIILSELVKSNNNGFLFLEGVHEIKSVKTLSPATYKHVGYKIMSDDLISDKIPAYLTLDQVNEKLDPYEDVWVWENYNNIRSLYVPHRVELPEEWKEQEFTVEVLREFHIDKYDDPINMKVKVETGYYSSDKKVVEQDLSNVVSYDELERLLTPEVLLHKRPCYITPEQVFKIVRQYVKDNIDKSHVRITSDYDFCFAVMKWYKTKPYTIRKEQYTARGNSYKPPRFTNSVSTEKLVEVFNIAPKIYNEYMVAPKFEADNLEEMVYNVKTYLEELMEVINRPMKECECCDGYGVVSIDTVKEK